MYTKVAFVKEKYVVYFSYSFKERVETNDYGITQPLHPSYGELYKGIYEEILETQST
jgi:hypothetical protein